LNYFKSLDDYYVLTRIKTNPAAKPPPAQGASPIVRPTPPVLDDNNCVVAVCDAVDTETDVLAAAEAVIVTGKYMADASVIVLVEVPVYLPAPEPLMIDVQLAVAELAKSHDI
jgi:hypothetical protein